MRVKCPVKGVDLTSALKSYDQRV